MGSCETPYSKAKQYQYAALYFIAIASVSFAKVSNDNIFVVIADYLSIFIPSIRLIAESTNNSNSAKIMMSVAWVATLPCSFFAIKNVNLNSQTLNKFKSVISEKVGIKNTYLSYAILLILMTSLFAAFVLGNPLGGYSWRRAALSKLVSIHTGFLSLYAVGVTMAVSVLVMFVYMGFESIRRKV